MDYGINASGYDTGKIYDPYSGKYINREDLESKESEDKSSSYLDFDSYLQLLVAQMSNQDFNNPMSDSEVLAQMAQYSMLEGIKNMTQQSSVSYASSLVGKVVTVSEDKSYLTGKVESISIVKNEPYLVIDGHKFKSSSVTDIVDQTTYDNLNYLIGKPAEFLGDEKNSGFIGTITHVLFMNGESWVALDGRAACKLSDVRLIDESELGDKNQTEGTEGAEGSGEGKTEGSDDEGELITESSEVDASAQTYSARSQALFDVLMRELDRVDETSTADYDGTELSDSDINYVLQTAYVEVPDYSAAYFADDDIYTTSVLENVDTTYSSRSGDTYTISRSVKETADSVSGSGTSYTNNFSGTGSVPKVKGVTSTAAYTRGDDVPHRISVEDYPEEAALADELGTRMYDIRFINNRAITSRILSGPAKGYTASGKGITEIGYSGVGQLGEVVTFTDGTQRVEILLQNGHSSWHTTSGNYTLDEICTTRFAPGSLSDLTPAEKAIRHYSRVTERGNETALSNFGNYLKAQGHA